MNQFCLPFCFRLISTLNFFVQSSWRSWRCLKIYLKILFEDLFGHTTSELLTRTPFPKRPGRGFQACSSRTDSQDPLGETGPTTPSRHWGPLRTSWASRCCLMKQTKGQFGNSVRFFRSIQNCQISQDITKKMSRHVKPACLHKLDLMCQ